METKTVDLSKYIQGHGLTYALTPSSTMVKATVDDAGMLSVSIDKTSTYSDYKVAIMATDSRGSAIADDVVVRRNREPVVGKRAARTDVIWLGTATGKNTEDKTIFLGPQSCKDVAPPSDSENDASCDFVDDDKDFLTFEVASSNSRNVTGAHKSKGKITLTGLKTSLLMGTIGTNIDSDADFASVAIAVRAKDSGSLFSDYREGLFLVKVNQAPVPKPGEYLADIALALNANTYSFEDSIIKMAFEDADAASLNDHTVSLKSSDSSIAKVSNSGDDPVWTVIAVGTGTATITATIKEPMSDNKKWQGLGQEATQTFEVIVRDGLPAPSSDQ
jgi:hypothetical protein